MRVSVEQAATELEMTRLTLCELMKQDRLKIGYAVKPEGSSKYTYLIYRHMLDEEKKRLGLI